MNGAPEPRMLKKNKFRCRIWTFLPNKKNELADPSIKQRNVPVDTGGPKAPKQVEKGGGSSCIAGSSLLETPTGLRRADSLQVGDYVVAPAGNYEPIVAMLHQLNTGRESRIFTTIRVKGVLIPLRVSPDHIVYSSY